VPGIHCSGGAHQEQGLGGTPTGWTGSQAAPSSCLLIDRQTCIGLFPRTELGCLVVLGVQRSTSSCQQAHTIMCQHRHRMCVRVWVAFVPSDLQGPLGASTGGAAVGPLSSSPCALDGLMSHIRHRRCMRAQRCFFCLFQSFAHSGSPGCVNRRCSRRPPVLQPLCPRRPHVTTWHQHVHGWNTGHGQGRRA
jgi:hypothetical protein